MWAPLFRHHHATRTFDNATPDQPQLGSHGRIVGARDAPGPGARRARARRRHRGGPWDRVGESDRRERRDAEGSRPEAGQAHFEGWNADPVEG